MGKAIKPITSVVGPMAGIPLGSSAASSVLKPIMGGALGDMLFGKEDPGVGASQVNIYTPEQQGLLSNLTSQYKDSLSKNNEMTRNQISQQENQARAGVEDQERKARDLVAQRGLGSSAVGLNALLAPGRQLSDNIGAIRAQEPSLRLANLNNLNSGIGNLLNAQSGGTIYNKAQASTGRLPGGIAPLLIEGGKMAMARG